MHTEAVYESARQRYAELGIDTDAAIRGTLELPIALHCWQTDDISGFETRPDAVDGGGILATGNYPGRARNGDEARADLDCTMGLIPGRQRVNLHACYAETATPVERDAIDVGCFSRWMDWAAARETALDFNPTCFAHPAAEGGSLSNPDPARRDFWIRHGRACRHIAQAMAEAQGSPCTVNWWTPDGSKDLPADRAAPRARMAAAYDAIFDDAAIDRTRCVDFIESKLFGIGSESYVVGSAEFCAGYAASRGLGLCLDMGHFHPTETIADKLSSHLLFIDRLLLHVSRPVRWDSDHVVLFSDDLREVFLEIQRGGFWDRVTVALDFFDASINRIAAYVIGTRAARKGILYALLDPTQALQQAENEGRTTHRLALMEAAKTLPFGSVWDRLCDSASVPSDMGWIKEMERYEADVLAKRH